MRWQNIDQEPCSIARTLAIIGDRWTLLILRNCFLGMRRFDDFQKQLGVTRHILTDRLNSLVKNEVLKKVPYQEKPTRYEYRLTEKGIDLHPVLMTLVGWGDKWLADEEGVPLEYVHRECGHKTTPTLVCSECGEVLQTRAIQAQIGPGLEPYLQDVAFTERWSETLFERVQKK